MKLVTGKTSHGETKAVKFKKDAKVSVIENCAQLMTNFILGIRK